MTFRELHDGWTLRLDGGDIPSEFEGIAALTVPATVPGVVHTDLLGAGLIPDPYVDDNESLLAWIGRCDWTYELTFDAPQERGDRHDLVAEGLDTVARIVLNGVEVATTRNQHRTYRWRVDALLRPEGNRLEVTFRSPIAYAEEREAVLGKRPHGYVHPYNTIRKTACNFGWDWGPALVTSGIWRRIGIESWSGVRIASVRPVVGVDGDARQVDVHVDLDWSDDAVDIEVVAQVAGERAAVAASNGTSSVILPITAAAAELWWPRGHGTQPLYELTVRAGDADWSRRIGFRTAEIEVAADADGSPFTVIVNGAPIYIRGANWIPEDTLYPRISRERLAERFTDAEESGMNLLRVWGGGIYESEDFYELADERGLLVWQDFLLACAAYSEDAEMWDEFEAEARDNVARLSSHPSLVVWNGGNENIWGWVDWNWRPRLDGATWGEGYYLELFPRVVDELAPTTPYSAGSPYGFSRFVHPNDPKHGTVHIWDVWNQVDYDVYRDYRPRFVSEFGFQGPPAWTTLFSVVHDEPADPYGPLMLVHQKANDGNGKLERGLGAHIAAPQSIDDWHWATQLNQARAVRSGIEHFRSLHPLNQGAIVWQLNDCWPVISWAAVDGHGIRKPLWHALRAGYADRLATIQPRDGGLALVLHNDSDSMWEASVSVRVAAFAGDVRSSSDDGVRVAARSAISLPLDVPTDDPTGELVVAELSTGERALWYFDEDPRLRLDPGAATATARAVDGGYAVRVRAASLAKDVTLLVDRAHSQARVDRGLVTLLAGEEIEFRVAAPAGLDLEALIGPLVLRSANDLVP
ncbi:glycoside hydrolase family 2 protein [Microbacterium sp. ARD32]|uniref:glycoside hydrolase family 2 protein n=1 Tax=Microbacterium sp. ARD32 TaxID=2962577 RepID=UPI0028818252|nr:glycoside hydrolase family 2 protein [Microbacterium sp. ARD32]MDT0157989.1 glycoside hydrolase family 2 protein [Microbacterium sp. ARD32]